MSISHAQIDVDCRTVPTVCSRIEALESEVASVQRDVTTIVRDLDSLEDRVASATLRKAVPWGAILMAIAGSAGDWIPAVAQAIVELIR